MTDDETALLRAIAAHPDDDTPRMVYADWLLENGHDARAEFMRLQLEIAKIERLPRIVLNQHSHLWKRQQELLDHQLGELLGVDATDLASCRIGFHRGFIETIEMPAQNYASIAPTLLNLPVPPTVVKVENVAGSDWAIFSLPPAVLEPITELRWQPIRLSLGLISFETDESTCLRAAGTWPRLRELDLSFCSLFDNDIEELFRPAANRGRIFQALEGLNLFSNQLSDAAIVVLLDRAPCRSIRRLNLSRNPMGNQAAMELADRWPRDGMLEHLQLSNNAIDSAGQNALLQRFGGKVDLF